MSVDEDPPQEFGPALPEGSENEELNTGGPTSSHAVHHRLHLLSPIIETPKQLRSLIPLILLSLFSRSETFDRFLIWAAAASLALQVGYGVIRLITLRYGVQDKRLIIRHGLISRTDRTIPFDRIKTIELRRGLFHRMLGVAELVVETAGDDSSEANLSVLSHRQAIELRQSLLERLDSRPSSERKDEVIWKTSFADLLVAGATESRTGAIMAALYGLYEFTSDISGSFFEPLEQISDQWLGAGATAQAGIIIFIILLLTLAGWGLSILISVITYYGFTLSRMGDTLRRSYGLITRQETELSQPRIQALRLESNLLRRLIGYVVVRADTAGSAKDDESQEDAPLSPPLPVKESRLIIRQVHPHLDLSKLQLGRVHRYAIRRGFLRMALPITVIMGIFVASSVTKIVFAWPPLLLFAWGWAWLRYRSIGYTVTDQEVIARSGVWTQRTWVVPLDRIQAITRKQDPFQRRLGLSTIEIATAGGRSWSRARVIDLGEKDAKQLFRTLSREAAVREWSVMGNNQD